MRRVAAIAILMLALTPLFALSNPFDSILSMSSQQGYRGQLYTQASLARQGGEDVDYISQKASDIDIESLVDQRVEELLSQRPAGDNSILYSRTMAERITQAVLDELEAQSQPEQPVEVDVEAIVDEVVARLSQEFTVSVDTDEVATIAAQKVASSIPSSDAILEEVRASLDPDAIADEVYSRVMDELPQDSSMRQHGFFVDGMIHATLLRGNDFVPGGTFAFGYRNGVSLYSLYTRFDYFLAPLGSTTGRLATLEFMVEPGLSFEYVVASQDWQEVRLAVDFGYYMQFIERYDEPTVFYLSYNGLMIRPTVSVRANLYLFRVELGLYYQSAVYPRYSDYDGFGLYIKLF